MKKVISALFLAFHLIVAYWGVSILAPVWLQLDVETPYSAMLFAMLLLLPVSCVYLLLMRKSILGTTVSIICFTSNLILYGFPALVVLFFRDCFRLSLINISHNLVLMALLIQYYLVIHQRRHRTGDSSLF